MHIEVPNIPKEILRNNRQEKNESSQTVRLRVMDAYQRQINRCGKSNSKLNANELAEFCKLEETQYELLEQAIEKLGLSARAMHRILRVTRTIADLAKSDRISTDHLMEAITYRRLEKIEPVMY